MKPDEKKCEGNKRINKDESELFTHQAVFNNEKQGSLLEINTAFNMGALLIELLMFERGDTKIDDDTILYREKNLMTDKIVVITFGDLKEAIISMKRAKEF